MLEYSELELIALGCIRDGQNISLPLICKSSTGDIVARYFVYAVNCKTKLVTDPFRFFEVNLEKGTMSEIELPPITRDIAFSPEPFVVIPDYQEKMQMLPELYQTAVRALTANAKGDSIFDYRDMVIQLTQPCLRQYCEALCSA